MECFSCHSVYWLWWMIQIGWIKIGRLHPLNMVWSRLNHRISSLNTWLPWLHKNNKEKRCNALAFCTQIDVNELHKVKAGYLWSHWWLSGQKHLSGTKVLSWSRGYEFKSQLGRTWGVHSPSKSDLNHKYNTDSYCFCLDYIWPTGYITGTLVLKYIRAPLSRSCSGAIPGEPSGWFPYCNIRILHFIKYNKYDFRLRFKSVIYTSPTISWPTLD